MSMKLSIKPLIMRDTHCHGAYCIETGEIFIGTFEELTPNLLWHEMMHKILAEDIAWQTEEDKKRRIGVIKATIQFDNIANELEYYLFGIGVDAYGRNYHYVKKNILKNQKEN